MMCNKKNSVADLHDIMNHLSLEFEDALLLMTQHQ
jgi:hypothetical protein